MIPVARRIALHLFFAVLLVAALLKFEDVTAFLQALSTWTLLPRNVLPVIALGVPAVELLVASLWFARLGRPVAVAMGGMLLVLFTGIYVYEIAVAGPPECGCLGRLRLFESVHVEMWMTVGRNVALASLLVFGSRHGFPRNLA